MGTAARIKVTLVQVVLLREAYLTPLKYFITLIRLLLKRYLLTKKTKLLWRLWENLPKRNTISKIVGYCFVILHLTQALMQGRNFRNCYGGRINYKSSLKEVWVYYSK